MTRVSATTTVKLRTLQARFAGQLPARMATIMVAWETLQCNDGHDALEKFLI